MCYAYYLLLMLFFVISILRFIKCGCLWIFSYFSVLSLYLSLFLLCRLINNNSELLLLLLLSLLLLLPLSASIELLCPCAIDHLSVVTLKPQTTWNSLPQVFEGVTPTHIFWFVYSYHTSGCCVAIATQQPDVSAYTGIHQIRCRAYKIAPEDGLIQSETCRASNGK